MQVHIWTFKDDVLLFNSTSNLVINLLIHRKCMKSHKNNYALMELLHNLVIYILQFHKYTVAKILDVKIMEI
jgi:hypothetical protein